MHSNSLYLTLFLSTFAIGLPLEGAANRNVARTKSYAIVNVDGGSTAAAPLAPSPTSVVDDQTKTKTVQVTEPPTTKTDRVTATVTSAMSSSSSPQPTITPSPSVITIIVTESAPPTSYYDNGLWHTNYPVKTWAALTTLSAGENAVPTLA